MLYVTIEDAPILIPNKEHSNFTQSNKVIGKGTLIEGNELFINGKRRGEDFTYKLFRTKDNNLIHLKKIKPMNVTEVTLGATGERYSNPSSPSPTVVNMPPSSKLLTTATIVGTIIGGVAGMVYANKKGFESSKKTLYIGGGALLGYLVSRYMERNKIIVKPSK
jgi:hypothetical protein